MGLSKPEVELSAATLLHDAKVHIETVGWTHGTEKDKNGRVCLLRALRDVDGTKHGKDVEHEAHRIVYGLIGTSSIPTWNDMAGRTKEEVLEVLQAGVNIAKSLAE